MPPLQYRREFAHWLEFVRLVQGRVYGQWSRFVFLLMGALPLLAAIVISAIWPRALDDTSVLFGILATLTMIGVLSRASLRRHVKDKGWILGDRTIVLSEQGVADAGNGTELRIDWPAIDGISVSKNLVVLWMEPAAGVFIPRTAFATPDDERSFVDFAEAHSRKV
jgi:YcxB-like protein